MPNWVFNHVSVKGNIKELDVFVDDKFDFNTLIKCPEEVLNTESSSNVEIGLAYLGYDWSWIKINDVKFVGEKALDKYLNQPFYGNLKFSNYKDLCKHIEERMPFAIEAGKNTLKSFECCGFYNWYDWSVANWGTKWNAAETKISGNSFSFNTAWNIPEPILCELVKKYSNLEFNMCGYEEALYFYYTATGKNGKLKLSVIRDVVEDDTKLSEIMAKLKR